MSRLVEARQDLMRLVKTCQDLSKLVEICRELFRTVMPRANLAETFNSFSKC
jgi:hypothetical protein